LEGDLLDRGWDCERADLISSGELFENVFSDHSFVLCSGSSLWIAISSFALSLFIQGPEHDTTEVVLLDIVDDLFINFGTFPETSRSLVSWLETHDDFVLVFRFSEVIQDQLILA